MARGADGEKTPFAHILPLFSRLSAMPSHPCPSSTQLPPTDGLSADLVVFGGTPGGIAAACSAAEEGLAVILLATSRHVGGHLSSGVCTTEIEHMLPESFSGWMLRFLRRIGQHYGVDGPLHRWEPHVAEAAFSEVLDEAKVRVVADACLVHVEVAGGRLRSVLLADGRNVSGGVFTSGRRRPAA